MRILWVVCALWCFGCKSDAEKACFGGGSDLMMVVASCGEECDRGDAKSCAQQTDLAIDACMKKHTADVCRWMCHYGKTGQDLYCAEYQKVTGKPAE